MFFRKAAAFLKRDLQDRLSFKFQSLLDGVSITAQCWIFFYLGKFVHSSLMPENAPPLDYFAFLLIGTAVAGYQFSALSSFSLAMHKEIGLGTLEAIAMTPTTPLTIIFSGALWSFLAATARMGFYFLMGFLFFGLHILFFHPLAIFCAVILTMAALSGLGMISAAFVLVYKRGDPVSYTLNGLTRLISGVYFPLSILPGWLQKIASFLPMTHALNLMRGLLIEGKTVADLKSSFLSLVGFALLFLPAGLWIFHRAVAQAKREGSLSYSD